MTSKRIALVGCSAQKLAAGAPAHELYTSPLFRASYAYGKATCDRIVIASALHGALEPDDFLKPYDFKLSERSAREREQWGSQTIARARRQTDGPAPVFVILAGELYARALHYGARWYNLPTPETPLAGIKGVGNRIRWLKEHAP